MSVISADFDTGRRIDGMDHLRQSVRDILTTPIGSRVMRRDYGSAIFRLIDSNMDAAGLVKLYAATADALRRWEPRLRVTRVQAAQAGPGHVTLTIEADYLPDGRAITIDGVQL